MSRRSVEEKIVQLGHLAGKLGGFVGESDSVNKAVKNAIIAVINSNEELKNEYSSHVTTLSESVKSADQAVGTVEIEQLSQRVSQEITLITQRINSPKNLPNNLPPSPSPSADSAELQPKLEALKEVQKLCENYENLKNAKDEPKNLLVNLCTGLETFLGFNSETKGYDGTGIVYSDLDRLCDGVMGFLYQVLKDVSDKQPYETGKEYLNTLVSSTLKSNLNSGHDGFCKAFPMVTVNVNRYNQAVKSSNENIKKKMEKLQSEMKVFTKNALKGILPKADENDFQKVLQAVDTVNRELDSCKNYAKVFTDALNIDDKSVNDAVDELHSPLSVRVKDALRTVKQESEQLGRLAERQQGTLKETAEKVKKTLGELKVSVDCKIGDDVKEFVDELKKKVKPIKKHLDDITTELSQYVIELQTWMEDTKKYINEVKDTHVKRIVNETTDSLTGKTNLIEDERQKVLKLKKDLTTHIESVRSIVKDKVSDAKTAKVAQLDGWKKAAGSVVEEAKRKCMQIGGMVVTDGTGNGEIYKLAKEMQDKAEELRVAAKHIKAEIGGWVGNATKAVGELEDVLKTDLYHVKDNIDSGILKYVNGLRDALTKGMEASSGRGTFGYNQLIGALTGKLGEQLPKFKEALVTTQRSNDVGTYLEKILYDLQQSKTTLTKPLEALKTAFYNDMQAQVETHLPKVDNEGTTKVQLTKLSRSFYNARTDGKDITKQTALKKAIEKIETDVNAKLLDDEGVRGSIEGENSTFTSPFTKIEQQLQQIAGLVDSDKKQSGIPGDGQKEGVINYLDDVTSMLAEDPVTLKSDIKSAHASIKGLETIKGEITTALDGIDTYVSNISVSHITNGLNNVSTEITKHLGDLEQAIDQTTNAVHAKLIALKDDKIGNAANSKTIKENTLQAISDKLDKLQKGLVTDAVKETKSLLDTYLTKAEEHYTKELKSHLNTQVKQAIETLTTHSQKQYFLSTVSLLSEYSNRVEKELKPLPQEIKNDLERGHKGFMNVFAAKFVSNIEKIKPITATSFTQKGSLKISPVSQAAKELNKSLTYCFQSLNRQADITADVDLAEPAKTALITVLGSIQTSNHFDNTFVDNLVSLKNTMHEFNPRTYGDSNNPWLLDALKKGLSFLIDELQVAYVSVYDGHEDYIDFNKLFDPPINVSMNVNQKSELTDVGRKLSKVCLTILGIIFEDISTLKKCCGTKCKSDQINTSTTLGEFFSDHGYIVSMRGKQHGELRDKEKMRGFHIYKILTDAITGADKIIEHMKKCESNKRVGQDEPIKAEKFAIIDLLSCIYQHIEQYNEVCHIATFSATRSPCSVYEMLIWLSGLTHNRVCSAMVGKTFLDLLKDPAKEARETQQEGEVDEPIVLEVDPNSISLDAYPKSIEFVRLDATLTRICSKAYDLICTIVGTGDEYTTYGCDYSNNSFKLKYPSDPAACFDMLLDILRRLLPQLRYLSSRCDVATEHHGWRNCEYGKEVPTSTSHCINETEGQANTKPKCQPNCQANTKVSCQPTSPLMSYLNDCLPGHLPHQLIRIGCKYECSTCPTTSKKGMPCLTPLGFRGFSGSTKQGKDLCEAIRLFFGSGLISTLLCLTPKPPSTLPEHFGFTLSLIECLETSEKKTTVDGVTVKAAFTTSITKLSVQLYTAQSDLTNAISKAYGPTASDHGECEHSHLRNLTSARSCRQKSNKDIECAPYLYTMCHDAYSYLAAKHTDVYLSWAIYLPWDFWKYLKHLYDSFCNINCADWGCRQCLQGTACNSGKHGQSETNSDGIRKSYCQCPSIVGCKGVSPTLYQYGFSFQDASSLNHATYPNTCTDFCSQLDKVLKSNYFVKLFTECDNFIWTIREPFTYLVLALWSLSLFYLICVMVGRLDVLHIRSHLRIPSSHRITAQSLLAAAQVGRLAKISYLQP
ncbi:hypothetical protein, conserved [Babesia bigemina]|uniref:C3H1-type domain-containing protein n=1 Tax=Babesia bigemina TaxID=5866 RepID=A0A061BLP0_BABBI|nr:hypothetical protein, conserved [Babesia bigemina]CDR71791.1 hypothetical protein, conserved [Babesia bigemina]|eukprot:XP_012770735.1 hypothetical protein, conserved [Babesia bigemina]